jgi:hypothetical protein
MCPPPFCREPLRVKGRSHGRQQDKQTAEDSPAPVNPSASQDPNLPDGPDLDPTKVVGTYAEQPDPNADKPAPLPNVPPGVNKAPKDDEPGARRSATATTSSQRCGGGTARASPRRLSAQREE